MVNFKEDMIKNLFQMIRKIFSLITTSGYHPDQRYQIFRSVLLLTILACTLVITSSFFFDFGQYPNLLAIPTLLTAFISFSLIRSRTKIAIHLFLSSNWLINTFASAVIFGGIFSPTVPFFVFQILLAGLTIGKRGVSFYTGLTLLSLIGLYFSNKFGIISAQSLVVLERQFLIYLFLVVPTGMIVYQMVIILVEAYKQIHDHAKQLENNNKELLAIQEKLEKIVHERSEEIIKQKIFYESLVDHIPVAVVTLDQNYTTTSCNNGFTQLFGYSEDEVLGQKLDDLITGFDTIQKAREYTQAVINGNTIKVTNARRRTKSGNIIYTDIYGVPVTENGELLGGLGLYVDSTERKRVEEALLESENRYRSLFEDSPISLWEEDFGDLKLYLNTLADSGIENFESYLNNHPEDIQHCANLIKINHINQATRDLLELPDNWQVSLPHIFTQDSFAIFKEELIHLVKGKTHFRGEISHRTLSGKIIYADLRLAIAPGYEHTWKKVFVSLIDITERKNVEVRLHYLSTHDNLTDLPNRFLLYDRLKHALALSDRTGLKVAALFVDLDRFKVINDTYGHLKGDLLLQAIAKRMTALVRESDTVARLGGDEFVIVLEGINNTNDATNVALKTYQALSQPFIIESISMTISASVGICIYPDSAKTFDDMIKYSDDAMYQAKQTGSHIHVYQEN